MLKVTESAKRLLKETLLSRSDEPEKCIRLAMKSPGNFGIVLDREAEGDQVVEHDGSRVLLVGPELVTLLDEVTIDTKDTAEGPKLVISKE